MLSLSFDGECVCARDYAIIQVLLYVSLTLNPRAVFAMLASGVEE